MRKSTCRSNPILNYKHLEGTKIKVHKNIYGGKCHKHVEDARNTYNIYMYFF